MTARLTGPQGPSTKPWTRSRPAWAGLLGAAILVPGALTAWCESARAGGPGSERAGDRIELRRQTLEVYRFWQAPSPRESAIAAPAATMRRDNALGVSSVVSSPSRGALGDDASQAVRLSDVEREQLRRQLRQRGFVPPTD